MSKFCKRAILVATAVVLATLNLSIDTYADTCKDGSAVVRCSELPKGVGARFERGTCSLVLNESTCALFGVSSDDRIDESSIVSAIPQNFEEALQICSAQHELTHKNDAIEPRSRRACTEERAYTVSHLCMERFGETYCDPNHPVWNPKECGRICLDLVHTTQATTTTQCLCSAGGDACEKCTETCEGATEDALKELPIFCNKVAVASVVKGSSNCAYVSNHYCVPKD